MRALRAPLRPSFSSARHLPCCVCRCACVIAFNINAPECLVRKEPEPSQSTEENSKSPSLNSTLGCLKVVDTFRAAQIAGDHFRALARLRFIRSDRDEAEIAEA